MIAIHNNFFKFFSSMDELVRPVVDQKLVSEEDLEQVGSPTSHNLLKNYSQRTVQQNFSEIGKILVRRISVHLFKQVRSYYQTTHA